LASLDQLPVYDSAQAQANAFARLGEDDPSLQMAMALEPSDNEAVLIEVPAAHNHDAPIFELSSPRDTAPTGDDTHEH
jgi:hypothetical protein